MFKSLISQISLGERGTGVDVGEVRSFRLSGSVDFFVEKLSAFSILKNLLIKIQLIILNDLKVSYIWRSRNL